MSQLDAYVESLLHFNLNFYLAFSPERGRNIGELVTMISAALARGGISCTAAEVKQCLENRIALQDGFVVASQGQLWLNFESSPPTQSFSAPPTQPFSTPMVAMAAADSITTSSVTSAVLEDAPVNAAESWEQQIWNSDFEIAAAAVHDVNAEDFPIRLLVAAYSKLRNVASAQFKEEYLVKLLEVLNNLEQGNGLNRLKKPLVAALRSFGETSTKKVSLESSRIVALMRPWIALL